MASDGKESKEEKREEPCGSGPHERKTRSQNVSGDKERGEVQEKEDDERCLVGKQ